MAQPRNDPEPRIAVVTGANRGIGLEVSRQLAAAGVRVVMTGRDQAAIDSAAADLVSMHLAVTPTVLDVLDAASIRSCAARIAKEFGRVDILVNNAAVLVDEHTDLMAISIDRFR